jgi:SAM-dependent methyltransferase
MIDAVLEVDWAAAWRDRMEARRAILGPGGEDYWDRQAAVFRASTQGEPDPFLDVIEPWLAPTRTLIDVGAGYGRLAVPLAERLEWVTVVEPTAGMRELIPDVDNMTVIASAWDDAEVQPADLVICSQVVHHVADPEPFLAKLDAAATEAVFVVLRDGPSSHPIDLIAGEALPRDPWLRDAFNLLRQMGIVPDVTYWRVPAVHRYESVEQAAEACGSRLGSLWRETEGRSWLEANLRPDERGGLVWDAGWSTFGALRWRPGGRG